jgi:hypothetical protein
MAVSLIGSVAAGADLAAVCPPATAVAPPVQARSSLLPRKPTAVAATAARPVAKDKDKEKVVPPQPRCLNSASYPDDACFAKQELCASDLEIAKIAWKYFERNYQPKTGMVNSVDGYPSATMWDLASALAGTIAAHELGLIDRKHFDDRVTAMIGTLNSLKLIGGGLPNKVYNTISGEMTDYGNKPTPVGIGYSALDLARLASWLDLLGCMHPRFAIQSKKTVQRWNLCKVIKGGQMYGAAIDGKTQAVTLLQEGRLGYEQYAGKTFARLGFDQSVSASYKNQFSSAVVIEGVSVPFDLRDPRKLGAFNFVVTESFALDAMEFGRDEENGPLVQAIYDVQKKRWERTGIVTAVSEDNIDRPPYFVYNTIFAAGTQWNALTDQGSDQSALRSLSTKAAFALAALVPEDPYSAVLMDSIRSAYDAEKGWYSGIYEGGLGYNKAITVNTNGIILQAMLFRRLGPLHQACDRCKRATQLIEPAAATCCTTCEGK